MEVGSDNYISNTLSEDETSARPQRKRIRIDDDEIRIEQNLIDTYSSVVVIKKHGTVSL